MKVCLFPIILFAIFLSGCTETTKNGAVIGVIRNLSGQVYYHPAQEAGRIRLQPGDINKRSLFALDKLVVEKDSFLHIYFQDHGDMFVEPETTLIIQKAQEGKKFQVLGKVAEGVVDCFIEKKNSRFAVQTPIAVAGVLGTAFKVGVKNGISTFTLLESKNGIEIQNLSQTLIKPLRLKMSEQNGSVLGSQVQFTKEPQEILDTTQSLSEMDSSQIPSSPAAGISSAKASSADSFQPIPQVQPVANLSAYTWPTLSKDKKLIYKSFAEFSSERVKSYER